MINKLLSEFHLITMVAPKPIKYTIKPKTTTYMRKVSNSVPKRSEILYSMDLLELIKFLKTSSPVGGDSKIKSTKLYTLLERIMLISDQDNQEVSEVRTSSFKSLRDFLSLILNQLDTFNNQLKLEIIDFMFFLMKVLKQLISENCIERLINKETFLVLMFQILSPLDQVYKTLRTFILKETKGLLDLSQNQKKMICQTIVFCKSIFSIYSSQSEIEKKAQESDKLIPPMDQNARYNNLVSLNEAYVTEIMSLPRAGHYMNIMLKKEKFDNKEEEKDAKDLKEMLGQLDDLRFKNLFNSFNFSKMSRLTDKMEFEEEKIESKTEIKGTLLPETQKNEKKMFIFSNIFVLLNKYFVKQEHE